MVRDSSTETQTDSRDDAQLLRVVAQHRDQAAFSELLRRYQSDAYALALRIVGQRDSAEDVVQEAMVRIWKTAGSYRGEGPVRGWLLRIIARESINTIQKLKRVSSKMKSASADGPDLPSAGLGPQWQAESAELAAALHREFDRLPELDRQLIGLHYGGGLSQQEISAELSIPQQTISNRLQRTLKTLRSALAAAGYTVVPLLAAEGLREGFGEALCSGIAAPAQLHGRVLAKIAARRGSARSRSARRTPKSNRPFMVGTAAVVVLAGGLWFVLARPAAQPAPSASPAPAGYDWHQHWTFERGLPSDLQSLSGAYTWNQGAKSIECPARVDFFATHRLPEAPLVFTMKCRILDLSKPFFFHQALVPANTDNSQAARELSNTASHTKVSRPEFVRQLYVSGRFWITTINGEVSSTTELEQSAVAGILKLGFDNLALEDITVTPLTDAELPEFVKHPRTNEK